MDSLIDRMEGGLRLKILSSTRRKNFFAHLKKAQQVHFANKVADPGKCMVTSIHPGISSATTPCKIAEEDCDQWKA